MRALFGHKMMCQQMIHSSTNFVGAGTLRQRHAHVQCVRQCKLINYIALTVHVPLRAHTHTKHLVFVSLFYQALKYLSDDSFSKSANLTL